MGSFFILAASITLSYTNLRAKRLFCNINNVALLVMSVSYLITTSSLC